jgi:dihydrofolate reductase
MRKIVAGLFITLDGVVEAPEKWNMAYFNEEMGAAVGAQTAKSDTMLLGRNTYETFAATFGPQGDDDPMAAIMNNLPKYVVSTTLDTADWKNSTVIKGDIAEQITALKGQDGKDITVSGSPTLVRWLVEKGLLDELQLMVHPLVLGEGAQLFPSGSARSPLTLVDVKPFSTGVVLTTYRPAES